MFRLARWTWVRGCPHAGVVLVGEVVNINDVLDGHVVLDLECVDRLYLNVYVPNLQVGGQVVTFLRDHLGNEIPSPALFKPIGDRFRKAVKAFAEDHDTRCCG